MPEFEASGQSSPPEGKSPFTWARNASKSQVMPRSEGESLNETRPRVGDSPLALLLDPSKDIARYAHLVPGTPDGRIVVQDYLADEDPERAEVWERVERLRDPDHRRLPRPGEVAELLAEHGFEEDEAQTWTASWSLDDWLEIAEPPYTAEAEIRRLVASDRFELTAWRARFTAR
jgi:hypothetical protein